MWCRNAKSTSTLHEHTNYIVQLAPPFTLKIQQQRRSTIIGKARPVSELREEFVCGKRSLKDGDVLTLGSAPDGPTWSELDDAQQMIIDSPME